MQPRGVLPRCCASAAEFALYGGYCMIADQAERAATLPLHGRLPQAARAQHLRRGAHARFGWLFLRGFAGAAVSRQPVLPWKQCTALEAMGAHQGRMHFPSLVCRFGARVKLGPQLLDLFLSGPPAAHPLFSCAFQKGEPPPWLPCRCAARTWTRWAPRCSTSSAPTGLRWSAWRQVPHLIVFSFLLHGQMLASLPWLIATGRQRRGACCCRGIAAAGGAALAQACRT